MIASFDYYNRFEEPIISLRSPDDAFMGFVPNVKNLTISPEFNAVSEMSCDVYQYNNGSADVDKDAEAKLLQVYEDIQVKRQLFVEGIGFFIINDVSEKKDENGEYKSLSLLSCEHELSYKKLTYFNGTYPFWNEASPEESLMGMLLSSLPRWSMGHVDSKVAERYRTFEEPDTTVYSFLMDDVEDSYECLFDFDIINRTINVYDKNSYIRKTSVFLSRKDVIGSLSIDTRSEQVYTALSLYGDGEITYRGINPLGGATVYNFAYYKSWMSEGLQAALTAWEETVATAETSVAALRTQLSNRNTELQTIQSNMDSIQEQITLLEKQLGVNTLSPDMITSLTAQIKQKKSELSETKKRYDEKYGEIQAINRQLSTIYDACSFSNNFTEEQLAELDAYIYEASEVDDTFAFTDDMSYEEQEEILTGLYQKAKSMLADISVPTEELSLDTNNFVFQKEFLPYTEQLNTGSIIDVEISDGVCVSYVLLKLDVNYGDKSVKLTLGNKYRTSNAEALWSSWQSNVSKSSTTLAYERSKYGKAVNSGSLDEMNRFMKSSLDLTLNQVKASDGQSIEISDSGLKGRRLNPETGEADKEQLWMTANNIVFTDDNWDTVKTAIGRLVMPDGTQGYGVNAEYLMGKWILGNGMEISNANGSFTINEDGIQSSYYDSEIEEVKSAAQQTEETINNLQIGGRNLARGTSVNYSAPFTNFNGGTNKTVNLGKVYTTGLSVGDVITVHLYYQYEDIVAASGQEAKVRVQGDGDVTGWAYGAFAKSPYIYPTGSGEHEILYSFTITEDRLKNSYWNVSIRHDYIQSGSVRYKMFKVEKGNKATDWTPAPEDTEGAISGLKETVTTQGTEISAIQGQISSKIWQQDITTAVDNLQVGGRNLILGSKTMFSDGEYQGFGYKYISEPMQDQINIGGSYQIAQFNGYGCFSFLAKKDSTQPTTIAFGFSGPGGGGTVLLNSDGNSKISVSLTDEWKRHWFIFKLKETENAPVPDIYIHLYHMGSQSLPPGETMSNSYFCAPKLESGNKPTDWTPAPEDAEGEITSLNTKYSEINQTVDGITATVGTHTTELKNLETMATQTAEKFSWVVASGTSETDFTLTDRTADLVAEQINLKGLVSFSGLDKDAQNEINQAITTANSAKGQATHVQGAIMDWCMNNDVTYINGGKIYTGSITASQIAAGAITSDKINVKDLSALNAKLGGWSVTSTAISQSHTAADGKTYTVNVSNYSNDNADSRVFHCSTNGTDTFAVRRNGQVNCSNIIATGGKVGGWSIASSSLSKTATYNGVDYNVLINGAPNSADSGAIIVRSKGSGETTWQNKFYVRYSGFMKATDADITGKITAISGKIGGFYIGENCIKSTSLAASSGGTGLYIFSTPEAIDLNGDGNTIKSHMAVAYNGHWEMCLSTTGSFHHRTHTAAASLDETASLE